MNDVLYSIIIILLLNKSTLKYEVINEWIVVQIYNLFIVSFYSIPIAGTHKNIEDFTFKAYIIVLNAHFKVN